MAETGSKRLGGRSAVVTGAAKGIGRARDLRAALVDALNRRPESRAG